MNLDGLLRRHADPALRPAGLRRRGRRYELRSERGDLSTLHIERRPSIAGEIGFNVGVSLLPATQRSWRAWQVSAALENWTVSAAKSEHSTIGE